MSEDTESPTAIGLDGPTGWSIAGVGGGTLGALAFGAIVWFVDPEVIADTLPAVYGLEQTGLTGWVLQAIHGAALGLLFGFLITRAPVLGVVRTDVETEALARTGDGPRLVAAGFVYGLTIWALLPVIVLPVLAGAAGPSGAADFPGFAAEILVGHLLFGIVLGVVFAALVDLSDRSSQAVMESSSEDR